MSVSGSIVCGGKVDYRSSSNAPSSIYTTLFLSKSIELRSPSVELWDVGEEAGQFSYSVLVKVPEGKLPSLIITVNVGIGISIMECSISHLALTSTTNTSVQVSLLQ